MVLIVQCKKVGFMLKVCLCRVNLGGQIGTLVRCRSEKNLDHYVGSKRITVHNLTISINADVMAQADSDPGHNWKWTG